MMNKDEARSFLASILGEEEVAKIETDKEADREQQIADARIFFEVFGTGRGPELLEILKHKTIYASTMNRADAVLDCDIPLNPGEFMAAREGQNALIRFIDRQMKLSQEKI